MMPVLFLMEYVNYRMHSISFLMFSFSIKGNPFWVLVYLFVRYNCIRLLPVLVAMGTSVVGYWDFGLLKIIYLEFVISAYLISTL